MEDEINACQKRMKHRLNHHNDPKVRLVGLMETRSCAVRGSTLIDRVEREADLFFMAAADIMVHEHSWSKRKDDSANQ